MPDYLQSEVTVSWVKCKYIPKYMVIMVKVEDLPTKIQNAMPGLSKSQRAIGDYIIKNYDKSAYLTASKLGSCNRSFRIYGRSGPQLSSDMKDIRSFSGRCVAIGAYTANGCSENENYRQLVLERRIY